MLLLLLFNQKDGVRHSCHVRLWGADSCLMMKALTPSVLGLQSWTSQHLELEGTTFLPFKSYSIYGTLLTVAPNEVRVYSTFKDVMLKYNLE